MLFTFFKPIPFSTENLKKIKELHDSLQPREQDIEEGGGRSLTSETPLEAPLDGHDSSNPSPSPATQNIAENLEKKHSTQTGLNRV